MRQPLLETISNKSESNELYVSFVVDKLIYVSSAKNQIYFIDKCFSKIKVFSEMDGTLQETINLDNYQRYASIYMDTVLSFSDQFLCVNLEDRSMKLYDKNGNYLLASNKLGDEIKNVSKFYLTQDGSYVFVDFLNDSIYYYN